MRDKSYIHQRLMVLPVLLGLLVVLATGVAVGQTPEGRKIGDGTEPAWSPNGRWILMSVLTDEQRDLFVIRPDGSERRQITDTPESELLATWSVDGRVAYINPTDIGLRLFVMDDPLGDAEQPREVRLRGYAPAFTSAPWTPDGTALTVVAGEYPELDIYRLPVDGSPATSLVANAGYDGSPAWSRDGRLAFVSDRGGNRNIWVRGRDRASTIQITNHGTRVAYPAWSPDGALLAYVIVTRGRGNDQLMIVAAPGELRDTR